MNDTALPLFRTLTRTPSSTPTKALTALTTLTLLLTACGGGGGGSTPAAVTAQYSKACTDGNTHTGATQAAADALCAAAEAKTSTIVTTVPADTYDPVLQAEEKAAFRLLNAERARCGFGVLAQNTLIDNAAKAHTSWILRNNNYTHVEVEGTVGFTGFHSWDRMTAAGYPSTNVNATEVLSGALGTPTGKIGQGEFKVRGWLAAPYHAIGALGRD